MGEGVKRKEKKTGIPNFYSMGGNIEEKLSKSNLSKKEIKLIYQTFKYRKNIPFIIVIILALCHQWIMHFYLFKQDLFFMIFNTVFYLALIWAAIWAYSYQRRIAILFIKLITFADANINKK